jgi:hypothetical protein
MTDHGYQHLYALLPTGVRSSWISHAKRHQNSSEPDVSRFLLRRADGRRSVRHFVNVDMSDIINSVTLFPLSNLPLAVRLRFNNCLNETNGGNLHWQVNQFAIRRQTIC